MTKNLIEKMPWLCPCREWIDDGSPDGKYIIPEDYDYSYTVLDEIPIGWKKRFGFELVYEIYKELIRQNNNDSYCVLQAKEKYGALRWYDNGNEDIQRIIDKYSIISEHTCTVCGKLDVPVRSNGWIEPMCDACYKKNYPNRKITYISKDCQIPDTYTFTKFSKKGKENVTIDISDTLKKLRRKII